MRDTRSRQNWADGIRTTADGNDLASLADTAAAICSLSGWVRRMIAPVSIRTPSDASGFVTSSSAGWPA